jgi:hypothetical protein
VEQGSVEELLARDGLFTRLWLAQRVGTTSGGNGNGHGARAAEPIRVAR